MGTSHEVPTEPSSGWIFFRDFRSGAMQQHFFFEEKINSSIENLRTFQVV